ncbi:MAG: hypothetical protein J6Y02_08115 [Pseudobutyrivibrio sp.]|nr:hypothetical protein [Pseudobutyrivibrio sp.]
MAKKKKEKEPGIRLSEKHGLNPTLGVCFFCGEETGEIGLLGKLKGDKEAPRRAVLNYDPCKKCQDAWKDGVALIACVTEQPEDGRPPISVANAQHPDLYPTGNYAVIKPEAAEKAFNIEKGTKVTLIEQKVLDKILSCASA